MTPQIIIPMSGFGERFRKAGFVSPKPLLEIEGKEIIAHVIDLFPNETDFLFICNQEHLDEPSYRMQEILARHCPMGRVVGIQPHKLGPVYAISQVLDLIDPRRPVVVNYCDFFCYWDWANFKRFVIECDCDGAVPAYRGFHPHSLGPTNVAYLQETDGWMDDIQEKQPFTNDRMQEYASTGTYYFSTGALMCQAFAEVQRQALTVAGEYYVSLAYKPLLESRKKVAVYDIQHFMQWGTPDDFREYRMWSDIFRTLVDPHYSAATTGGVTLIPMAGEGDRFRREGYNTVKPLIPVSGQPMVVQAGRDLPGSNKQVFVLRSDMPENKLIVATLNANFPASRTVVLDSKTDGQARTALLGWRSQASAMDAAAPLTLGTCDTGAIYRNEGLKRLLDDVKTDLVVWVARGYPNAARNPHMYGWVVCDGDVVTGVSVKKPLEDPAHDPIIIGTFTFRRGRDFESAATRMIAREGRINGEYYIDACIEDALELGLSVRIFEVDSYLCWGTPNELRTFEYWQSCFDKWRGHPYTLENDPRVPSDALDLLRQKYNPTIPRIPIH